MCKIIDAEDTIASARDLVEIARMAAGNLNSNEANAFATVLGEASRKLASATDLLSSHLHERRPDRRAGGPTTDRRRVGDLQIAG
jgi:hypothetical protein